MPGGTVLSRPRLDNALVGAAVSSGAVFLPETRGSIGGLRANAREVILEQKTGGARALARVVLVATGLGPVRSEGSPQINNQVKERSRIGVGCTLNVRSDFYHEGTIFMAVGQGGYVGLVVLETGSLNVGAALDRTFVRTCGGPGKAADKILNVAGFPAIPALSDACWQGTIPMTRQAYPIAGERFFLLGDAAGYVEPFTGEGIGWAMISGQAVAPVAREAIFRWNRSLPRLWMSLHRRLIVRKQFACIGLTSLLRQPRLTSLALEMVTRIPGVARHILEHLNGPSVSSSSS
jgi:flavin-dependent dehydrogenase